MTESYHTQHSPLGAFASFTIGLVDAPGGFGQGLRGPAQQNVYVGFRRRGQTWQLLPFFKKKASQLSAFTGEAAAVAESGPSSFDILRPHDYERRLSWASDVWQAGPFAFGLRTPFSRIEDPTTLTEGEARFHFAPVVCGFLAFDNSAGADEVELIFGLNESELQLHTLDQDESVRGFAGGAAFAFGTHAGSDVALRQSFSLFAENPQDYRGLHLLGPDAGLVFKVAAGAKAEFPLALAFYQTGTVTTGLSTNFGYTRWFAHVAEVLQQGLREHARYTRVALERDAELQASALSADQKFLLAQATHSYLGSTQLLVGADGFIWNVNEGEYRMINTFDLTVDHLFFELAWHPWAVRNALDLFASRYSYFDAVKTPEGRLGLGGISFTHDMGVNNHFTPPTHSSYECDHLSGCFSHMTMEQLLNWIVCAISYAFRTADWDWLQSNRPILLRCVESLENRDHPEPRKRDGLLKCDSSRCGRGSEITTYDSLDVSLGQARNNLYLAVKTAGAWILLERAFQQLSEPENAERARRANALLAATLASRFETDTGFFPAVFEQGNRSRILPAVEGLVYPLYLGFESGLAALQPLMDLLREHVRHSLQPGICLDEKTGGWKISSTSRNTWFSKIAIAQHVVRKLFPDTWNEAAQRGDRVHADWQRTPGCGSSAMCDQIYSDTGVTCGSRYYPRCVTAFLWLTE